MLTEIENHNLAALISIESVPLKACVQKDKATGRIMSATFYFIPLYGFDPEKIIKAHLAKKKDAIDA